MGKYSGFCSILILIFVFQAKAEISQKCLSATATFETRKLCLKEKVAEVERVSLIAANTSASLASLQELDLETSEAFANYYLAFRLSIDPERKEEYAISALRCATNSSIDITIEEELQNYLGKE